jgi:Zn-dependent peptidase ImmA (M78 family)
MQFRRSLRRTAEDDAQLSAYLDKFEELCRDYLELEQITGSPLPDNYPPEYRIEGLSPERAAEVVAQEERKRFGLGDGPIPLLRDLLEQEVGLRIFYLDMQRAPKCAAMYSFDRQLGGCIAVNRLHPEERRRLSLAHEYAHFLMDRYKPEVLEEDGYQRFPESERFAESFALYFLMPTIGLTRRFNDIRSARSKVTPADLCTLAHYYGVSVEAMTRRLEELKLLPAGTWTRLSEGGFRVREAQEALGLARLPANEDELPKRYQVLAVDAYHRGYLTEGQLARFLRVDRLKAREIAESLYEETESLAGVSLEPTHELAE